MIKVLSVLFAAVLVSCKPSLPPQQTYEQIRAQVDKGGPYVSPPIEESYKDLFKGATTKGVKAGEAAPFDGLLYNPQAWALFNAFKTERDKLRAELEAERKRAEVEKVSTTQTITGLKSQLDSSSSWWSRNKGLVGMAVGSILGMAITTSIVYALTKGRAIETTSGALRPFPSSRPLLRW